MVYIAEVSRRGKLHPERNEDNYYYLKDDNKIVGGIFDGCSTGRDSYFSSKLFANVLRETLSRNADNLSIHTFSDIVFNYVKQLLKTVQLIGLNQEETLTTALLFFYDISSEELYVKFFGDGVAYLNSVGKKTPFSALCLPGNSSFTPVNCGFPDCASLENELFLQTLNTTNLEVFNNDEQNQPDYLGYSLQKLNNKTDFENYWKKKPELKKSIRDFTLSSDGILSFRKTSENIPDFDIADFIARDNFLATNPAALKRKVNIIQKKGFEHYDDFTALRVIKM